MVSYLVIFLANHVWIHFYMSGYNLHSYAIHAHISLNLRPTTTNFIHVWNETRNISLFHEILWTNSLKSRDEKDEIRLSWKFTYTIYVSYTLEIYVLLRDTNYIFELFCSQFACRWKILLALPTVQKRRRRYRNRNSAQMYRRMKNIFCATMSPDGAMMVKIQCFN